MLFFLLFALSTVSSLHNMGYYRTREIEWNSHFLLLMRYNSWYTVTNNWYYSKRIFSLSTRLHFYAILFIFVECRVIYDLTYKYHETIYTMLELRLFSLTARYSAMVSNKCLFALFAHEMRFFAWYLVRSNDVTLFWYYMSLTCVQERCWRKNCKWNWIWKSNNFPERSRK